jgi:hypothetical protein
MKKSSKKKPTWTDLKRQLADLDRPALLGLIQCRGGLPVSGCGSWLSDSASAGRSAA